MTKQVEVPSNDQIINMLNDEQQRMRINVFIKLVSAFLSNYVDVGPVQLTDIKVPEGSESKEVKLFQVYRHDSNGDPQVVLSLYVPAFKFYPVATTQFSFVQFVTGVLQDIRTEFTKPTHTLRYI